MANSAFTPSVLTIGSAGGAGELNVINNSSGALGSASGWVGATASTTISPLSPTVSTSLVIANAAVAEGPTSGGYYSISQLPTGLQNRKLKVEFYYTTPASDTYRVSVYKGSTRVALSTDSSNVTTLPANTTGKFTAYFDTDASASWSLNITRTSGTAGPCYITNVVVGPGIQPQGAVVGEWQSYTPTFEGLGTVTNNSARYRRVGESMQVSFSVTSGTNTAVLATISLPSGFTINSTSIPNNSIVGDLSASATPFDSSILYFSGASSKLYFTSGTANYTAGANGTTWANSTGFGGNFFVPIAEWAGSGTVQLAQNDLEYLAKTSAWGTTDTTTANNVYGPAGAQGGTTTPGVTAFKYRLTTQTPIQAGDRFDVEISEDRATWRQAPLYGNVLSGGIEALRNDGTNWIGAGAVPVSSNTLDVVFGKYAYGTTGAWNGTWYWRVRKSSAGAAVGFGIVQPGVSSGLVSASGLPGNTTGNAIATGYVGEVISSRLSVATNATAGVYNDVRSINLTAGIWLLTGHVTLSRNAATFTSIDVDSGFGAIAGNTGPALSAHYHIADVSTSFTRLPLTIGATVVRCDGTNIYRDDGTSYVGTTVYLKCYVGTVTAGTPQFIASSFINAIRIA